MCRDTRPCTAWQRRHVSAGRHPSRGPAEGREKPRKEAGRSMAPAVTVTVGMEERGSRMRPETFGRPREE